MTPATRRLRLVLRVIILLALAGIFGWQLRPLKPAIVRPSPRTYGAGLIGKGQEILADSSCTVATAPFPILRLAVVKHPQKGPCLLILTAEQPGPQPRLSHLYLARERDLSQMWELSPEPDYNFWDVSVGDVDGDGTEEVALCTYSHTARDPNVARRFFVYRWDEQGDLEPAWRGSQLCRPYVTAALADMAGDDAAELVSVERALSGKLIVVAYRWNQFGFWGLGHTGEYDAIGEITPVRTAGGKALRLQVRRLWRIREVLWQP